MEWIEERKTANGYLIQITEDNNYQVVGRKGPEVFRNSTSLQNIPRIVFLGPFFNLDHLRLGEVSFVNVKSAKVLIPYLTKESSEIKYLSYPTLTESDVLPVIVFHKQTSKDLQSIHEKGIMVQHVVIEESYPKSDMINLKIRYPNINVLIIKKKVGA